MVERSIYDSISPIDSRYYDERVARYVSDEAFVRYKLRVELALVKVLAELGVCGPQAVTEVEQACALVTAEEVDWEEARIKHDIRALVNCLQRRVSDEVKPFVHATATSYDIVNSANALRFKELLHNVLLPDLKELTSVLIRITEREADTIQIGRTHGQHAVPITFGFAMAGYVNRFGDCLVHLADRTNDLIGKFSGAVGAYNASRLFFEDVEDFERRVLGELGLHPGMHSTQIVASEPLARLMLEVVVAAGVMANLADDMRHLQRTEIGEIGEEFAADAVGSSTMPQKRNPISFENVKGMWKILSSRATLLLMDQVSEHQRDLTNSVTMRTYGEIVAYAVSMTRRLTKTMSKMSVDRANMERNLQMQGDLILSEPLQLLLSAKGHPAAHEKVRQLTLRAQAEGRSVGELAMEDEDLQPILSALDPAQLEILSDPKRYTGLAAAKARQIAAFWTQRLGEMS